MRPPPAARRPGCGRSSTPSPSALPLLGIGDPSRWMFQASHGSSSSAAIAQAASGAIASRSRARERHTETAPNAATKTTSSMRASTSAPISSPASSTRLGVQRSQRSSSSTAPASATSVTPVSSPLWKSRKMLTEPPATIAAAAAATLPSPPCRRTSARASRATSTTNATNSSVEKSCDRRRPRMRSPPAIAYTGTLSATHSGWKPFVSVSPSAVTPSPSATWRETESA